MEGLLRFILWLTLLHIAGIFLFSRGFLLARVEIDTVSSCKVEDDDVVACPKPAVDKLVILIIDAMR
jgi:phosphatidylinositol glycan class O